jgi:uncharacterized protein YndB with AHSA1/START domain
MNRLLIGCLWLMAANALAVEELAPVVETETVLPDGSRVLIHSVVVDASPTAVWDAFTTAEGWMSWAVPFARVELRIGGLIETSYDAAARAGDPANIRNRILSFLPRRMLSIQAVQAPTGFPHADKLPDLHSVIEIEPIDEARARVTITGVGYRAGSAYDELMTFFRQANAWSLERLRERFATGPTDWATLQPPATQSR